MPSKRAKSQPKPGKGYEDERLFRDLAEKSLVGIYLIQDELFRYTNERMGEIFGYSGR